MFGFFDQIDLNAVLGRFRSSSAPVQRDEPNGLPVDSPPEDVEDAADEVVAAALHILDREGTASPQERGERSRRLAMRSERLLATLRTLGCEVRSGKGSEITIYRAGGHVFTLGHHRRNAHVGWAQIRRLLKRVEIPVEEWLDTVVRRRSD